MKKCPFCGNEIQDAALKCKYCKEWLPTGESASKAAPSESIVAEESEPPTMGDNVNSNSVTTTNKEGKDWTRFIPFVVIVFFAIAAIVSNSRAKLSKEYVLELCQYIPNHSLNSEAKHYMTKDFYNTLHEAFEVLDPFAEGEFLYYFVTGQDGNPYFEVLSIANSSESQAVATIRVSVLMGEKRPTANTESHVYSLILKKESGKWLIDDFDNKKQECKYWLKYKR